MIIEGGKAERDTERERERNTLLFFLVQKAMNVENRRGADVKFVLQPF